MRLYKLKKTDEFSSVFDFKKRFYGEWLFAHIKPNAYSYHRFGLVVSKKVSKLAVRRNYMKRVLRALIQTYTGNVNQGYDIVLQVRKPYSSDQFKTVSQDFNRLLHRLTTATNRSVNAVQAVTAITDQSLPNNAG